MFIFFLLFQRFVFWPLDMKTCNSALRAIGIVLGAWGFVGCLFFTIAFTFRQDAWQIFGGTMLVIIILLGKPIKFANFCSILQLIPIFCSVKCFSVFGLAIWSGICKCEALIKEMCIK